MSKHIIFFDDRCPFCCHAVRRVIALDEERRFLFAPLRGHTAHSVLTGPQERLRYANSLILAEQYRSTERRFWIRSHATLRILWLIGNGWGLVGIFSFFPTWLGDWVYKWCATHRHQFGLDMPEAPGPPDRFLP